MANMRRSIQLCVFLLLISTMSSACGPGSAVDPAEYHHTVPIEYFLYVPRDYSVHKTLPLFVGIHGSGGTGRDCWSSWQPYAEKEGFILLCPSLADSSGGWYQNTAESVLENLITMVRNSYNVKTKVYLAGFSAGAQFVQGYAFNHPGSVGGAAVLSSGNFYYPNTAAVNVPFLVVVGRLDNSAMVDGANSFVSLLETAGNPVEFHLLRLTGHTMTRKHKELTIDMFSRTVGMSSP